MPLQKEPSLELLFAYHNNNRVGLTGLSHKPTCPLCGHHHDIKVDVSVLRTLDIAARIRSPVNPTIFASSEYFPEVFAADCANSEASPLL